MKKYLSFFRIRFINGLQYRAAAYAGIITQFAWGFMECLLFAAFYRSDPSAFPMTFPELASYIWLQQALLALFMTWFQDNEISQMIVSGNIAYELCRPLSLYNMWIIKNMASRLSKAVLRCMPILVVAVFLPEPFTMKLPEDFKTFCIFLITGVMSFILVNAFGMFVYIITFYTLSPVGVRIILLGVSEFLTGAIVPLPFLPDGVQKVFNLLPFAAMQNLPLRIYSGNISGDEMVHGIILQVFWVAVLIITGKLWMGRVVKRAVSQGG